MFYFSQTRKSIYPLDKLTTLVYYRANVVSLIRIAGNPMDYLWGENTMKRILIAYASKTGTTKRAAETLARALAPDSDLYDLRRGTLRTLSGTETRIPFRSLDLTSYRAIALGSAMYMGRPVKPFLRVVQETAQTLQRQPLFLFTCGLAKQEEEQSYLWPLLPGEIAAHAKELHHMGGELCETGGFFQRMMRKDYEKKGLALPKLDEAAAHAFAELLKQ